MFGLDCSFSVILAGDDPKDILECLDPLGMNACQTMAEKVRLSVH
jgi:hypothetical protein